MQYNFDQKINRLHTASLKWDTLFGQIGGVSDVLSMWLADMDFQSPAPVIEAIKQRAEQGLFGYTLRETYFGALAEWMWERHHWCVNQEWMVNSPGVVPALGMIIDTFTDAGDKVLIQQPVYYPFANLVHRNGRILVNNSLRCERGRYVMDFEDLERKLAGGVKLMILCNPHNPVGRVWTREELTILGQICLKHKVLVASDEIHSDLVLPGHTHTPFASINREFSNASITCVSPSKTFNLAGLQTATVIIPDGMMRLGLQATLQRFSLGAGNVFGVIAADSAYRYGKEWLEQLLEYLQGNVNFMTNYFEKYIPQICIAPLEGTYLVWMDCRDLGVDSDKLNSFFLHYAKVALDTGEMFGDSGKGFMRMNIACPRSSLEKALKQVKFAVQHIAMV